MVTLAEAIATAPTKADRALDAAYVARDTLARGIRTTVAGSPTARIRRGVLYLVTGFALVVGVPVLGVLSVLLLAWTDSVIEVSNE